VALLARFYAPVSASTRSMEGRREDQRQLVAARHRMCCSSRTRTQKVMRKTDNEFEFRFRQADYVFTENEARALSYPSKSLEVWRSTIALGNQVQSEYFLLTPRLSWLHRARYSRVGGIREDPGLLLILSLDRTDTPSCVQ